MTEFTILVRANSVFAEILHGRYNAEEAVHTLAALHAAVPGLALALYVSDGLEISCVLRIDGGRWRVAAHLPTAAQDAPEAVQPAAPRAPQAAGEFLDRAVGRRHAEQANA